MDQLNDFNAGDPVIVALCIILTALLKKFAPPGLLAKIRPLLPGVVVLIAVGLRAAYDVLLSEAGVTWDGLLRAAGAGVTAVWGHAQYRSLTKDRTTAGQDADGQDADQSS